MPSGGSDRPRQIDAFVAEVLGQHCDVLARADHGSPPCLRLPEARAVRSPKNLKLGSLGIPKRKCWSKDTCGLIPHWE
jgi:hypothetical protein